MQPFALTVLGSSSALPAAGRNPSAHVLQVHERFYLIDCGEGCQMQLRRFNFSLLRIEAIFITHLHGDHYFGLPGLLGSMHLLGRKKPLPVYSPEGLKEIIELQHKHSDTFLQFPLEFHVIKEGEQKKIFEDERVSVSAFPLQHRIPCTGYLFEERSTLGNLDAEKATKLGIPKEFFGSLKRGLNYTTKDGEEIMYSDLITPPPPRRRFAYCSDTKKSSSFISLIKGVDLLYHEATFMQMHEDKAKKTFHSTAADAAETARDCEAKRLLISHFSARYGDVTDLLAEAQAIFPNTVAAEEGKSYSVEM